MRVVIYILLYFVLTISYYLLFSTIGMLFGDVMRIKNNVSQILTIKEALNFSKIYPDVKFYSRVSLHKLNDQDVRSVYTSFKDGKHLENIIFGIYPTYIVNKVNNIKTEL